MVEQLKLGGVIGWLIEIFKARNTQGSYLGAGFRVSPLGTLFVFISSLPPLANCACVWSTYKAENSLFFFNTYPWLFFYPLAINYPAEQQRWDQLLRKWKRVRVRCRAGADSERVVARHAETPLHRHPLQWQSLSRESSGLQLHSGGVVRAQSHSNPYSLS